MRPPQSTTYTSQLPSQSLTQHRLTSRWSCLLQPAPLFGLSKLVDTALQNIHRIDTTWPIVSAHLILVSNHKVTIIYFSVLQKLKRFVFVSFPLLST